MVTAGGRGVGSRVGDDAGLDLAACSVVDVRSGDFVGDGVTCVVGLAEISAGDSPSSGSGNVAPQLAPTISQKIEARITSGLMYQETVMADKS